MKKLTLITSSILTSALGTSVVLASDWFPDTPLQASYSALAEGNAMLAWQELQLSLSQNTIQERYWRPVKQAILTETQCGKQLTNSASIAAEISLSIIRKGNATNQGYQVKLSAEKVSQPIELQLFDADNRLAITATIPTPAKKYHEFESNELLIEPKAGLYQLSVNGVHYPLVISSFESKAWLQPSTDRAFESLIISPPSQTVSCSPATVSWQWLDKQYNLLDRPSLMSLTPITADSNKRYHAQLPESLPAKTELLSAVVSQYEYQGRIKVEYVQRLSLPVSGIETYR
ncbi:DUF2861 family protein [Photobacterium kasasachensis]|uniref:DUF2861 family protein n=1 Tax=Photobacterium kasasachensis TaxID=2910240 RepID=UPI003D14D7C7